MPMSAPVRHAPSASNHLLAYRSTILSVAKLLVLAVTQLPFLQAAPLSNLAPLHRVHGLEAEPEPKPADDPSLWIYLAVAAVLVLLGGAFAGLTIALMGQDEIYLQVIRTSGEPAEKKHAAKVLHLLDKGKHWVLVTLLLSNVITNETLPIVLDRSLGGGWPAVLGSTVLIVIFGEIMPQSVCVRYGLPIGAWMSPFVLALMYFMAPVAWPTAKLLDWLLGEDHGTVYKKAGLKTLVTLHKTLGVAGEQLNSDEVTIISAVLDLKEKSVGSIMTPMEDVFTMSADTVLDEPTMDRILSQGYSRIPIYAPDNKKNFVGMLLVKILITYDPEDCKMVRDFALATLPETRPETSCLDIVNFFQEGKSHMVLVSEFPGEDRGAAGVVTLEDVIEELIGEEIIDESDVFVDVHKAIRRIAPAPRTRVPKGTIVQEPPPDSQEIETEVDAVKTNGTPDESSEGVYPFKARASSLTSPQSPKMMVRRRASGASGALMDGSSTEAAKRRAESPEMFERFRHLGPSNLASRPKTTRFNTVKIKPGADKGAQAALVAAVAGQTKTTSETPMAESLASAQPFMSDGEGAHLLSSAGLDAKDGALAVQQGTYGTLSPPRGRHSGESDHRDRIQTANGDSLTPKGAKAHVSRSPREIAPSYSHSRQTSTSTVGSLPPTTRDIWSSGTGTGSGISTRAARSGSITENIIETGGIRKVVLEMTSSSSSSNGGEDGSGNGSGSGGGGTGVEGYDEDDKTKRRHKSSGRPLTPASMKSAGTKGESDGTRNKKTRRRHRRRDKKGGSESEPLLPDQS